MNSLFGQKNDTASDDIVTTADIQWARNKSGRFHNLMFVDAVTKSLKGISGVYVIWKGGAKPQWLYVGATKDLAEALEAKIDDPEIEYHHDPGGISVTWALIKPEFQGGIVHFLTDAMKPRIKNPDAEHYASEKPIPVYKPGFKSSNA